MCFDNVSIVFYYPCSVIAEFTICRFNKFIATDDGDSNKTAWIAVHKVKSAMLAVKK